MNELLSFAKSFSSVTVYCVMWSGLLFCLCYSLNKYIVSIRSWPGIWLAGLMCAVIPILFVLLPDAWRLHYLPLSFNNLVEPDVTTPTHFAVTPAISESAISPSANRLLDTLALGWTGLFIVGLLYFFLRVVGSYFRLFHIVATAKSIDDSQSINKTKQQQLQHLFTKCVAQNTHGKNGNGNGDSHIRLLISSADISPFTYSFLKPVIVLPSYCLRTLSDSALNLVIEHELVHLRRRDSWLILFSKVCQCLQWFNPFIGYFCRRLQVAVEIHCDQAVLQAHPQQRREYIDTMLTVIKNTMEKSFLSAPAFGQKPVSDLKDRLYSIQTGTAFRNNSFKKLSLTITSLILVTTSFVAQPQTSSDANIDVDALLKTVRANKPIKEGRITARYGKRLSPFDGKEQWHRGIDLADEKGTKIYATANGQVVFVGSKGDNGNTVDIDHGHNVVTRYTHMDSINVTNGQKIVGGEVIGLMGVSGLTTGPHVHYEVIQSGKPVCPTLECASKNL